MARLLRRVALPRLPISNLDCRMHMSAPETQSPGCEPRRDGHDHDHDPLQLSLLLILLRSRSIESILHFHRMHIYAQPHHRLASTQRHFTECHPLQRDFSAKSDSESESDSSITISDFAADTQLRSVSVVPSTSTHQRSTLAVHLPPTLPHRQR